MINLKLMKCLKNKILLIFLLSINNAFSSEKPEPDLNKTNSFNFNAKHVFCIPSQNLFIASDQKLNNLKNFALSQSFGNSFLALAPKLVKLNNKPDIPNPVYGTSIEHITLLNSRPLVVLKNNPNVFLIAYSITINGPDNFNIISSISPSNKPLIRDTFGKVPKKIFSITTSSNDINEFQDNADTLENKAIFIAVSGQENFDSNSAGIAVLFFAKIEKKDDQNKETKVTDIFASIDAAKNTGKVIRAAPLNKNSAQIKINSKLASIGNIVDLHYDSILKVLFIALELESGSNDNDGLKAVCIAGFEGKNFYMKSIVEDKAVDNQDRIIATQGKNKIIKINKVRTMHTTTCLDYLITIRHNNDQSKVYALPIVNNIDRKNNGTLANVNKIQNWYTENNFFINRSFDSQAKLSQELYNIDSTEAKVGGYSLLPSEINDIQIVKDSVFVSCKTDGNNLSSGIYFSQAIFDAHGKILNWTNWQKAAESTNINGFALDANNGNLFAIQNNSSETKIKKSNYTNGNTEFEKFISKEFEPKDFGVLNIFDFAHKNKAFNQSFGQRLSLLILTGKNKVLILQSGKDNDHDIFKANLKTPGKVYRPIDGALSKLPDQTEAIIFDNLKSLGKIDACEIVNDSENAWLVLGASKGLAILAKSNGHGWNSQLGLKKDFDGLSKDLSLKFFNNIKDIIKISSVKNNLFILTKTDLYKIILTSESIKNNKLNIKLIAQAGQNDFYNTYYFSDVIITGPLAILATSNGLFRSANSIDINKVGSQKQTSWVSLDLPEAVGNFSNTGPVVRLFGITKSGQESDLCNKGNLYVLNAYTGYRQAQIYRFYVNVENNIVQSDSILLFEDKFVQDLSTFFVNLKDYKNYIYTDGAIITTSSSSFFDVGPRFNILPKKLKAGDFVGASNSILIDLGIKNYKSINKTIRDSASGSLIITGDFGIRLNQLPRE